MDTHALQDGAHVIEAREQPIIDGFAHKMKGAVAYAYYSYAYEWVFT